MKIGKFSITRKGIRWMYSRQDGETLVIGWHQLPPDRRKQYGHCINITRKALMEERDPNTLITNARFRLMENYRLTNEALTARRHWYTPWRPRGLDYRTMKVVEIPFSYSHDDPLGEVMSIGWKAYSR